MRVCSSCFAEGIDEDICPFCGQVVAQQSMPSIISLKANQERKPLDTKDGVHPKEKDDKNTSFIDEIYVGQHIYNRYTIQRDFGVQENWLFYQAIDHLQGRECIIKVATEKSDKYTHLPFLRARNRQ